MKRYSTLRKDWAATTGRIFCYPFQVLRFADRVIKNEGSRRRCCISKSQFAIVASIADFKYGMGVGMGMGYSYEYAGIRMV